MAVDSRVSYCTRVISNPIRFILAESLHSRDIPWAPQRVLAEMCIGHGQGQAHIPLSFPDGILYWSSPNRSSRPTVTSPQTFIGSASCAFRDLIRECLEVPDLSVSRVRSFPNPTSSVAVFTLCQYPTPLSLFSSLITSFLRRRTDVDVWLWDFASHKFQWAIFKKTYCSMQGIALTISLCLYGEKTLLMKALTFLKALSFSRSHWDIVEVATHFFSPSQLSMIIRPFVSSVYTNALVNFPS